MHAANRLLLDFQLSKVLPISNPNQIRLPKRKNQNWNFLSQNLHFKGECGSIVERGFPILGLN